MGILTRATRSLMRRKTRALIVIAALTLALTLITVLPPSINARQELTQNILSGLIGSTESLEATVTLSATEVECGYPLSTNFVTYEENGEIISGMIKQRSLMNETLTSKLALIPDVVDVVPVLIDYRTRDRPYDIHGIDVDNAAFHKTPTLLPTNITKGRNLQPGDSGVIVIDEWIAKNVNPSDNMFDGLEDLDFNVAFETAVARWVAKEYVYNVGDSFEILGRKFTIVGIEAAGLTQGSQGVTMSLVDAQTILGKAGQVSLCKVFVNNVDNVNSVVARIRDLDSGLTVSSGFTQLNAVQPMQDQVAVLILAAESNLNQVQRVGMVEIGVGVVAAVAVILFMMLYSVRERTREIGTLKAMGASTSKVLGQFMLEGILLSVVAAVFAVVISVFVLPQLASLILPVPIQEGVTLAWDANGVMYLSRTTVGSMPFFGEVPRVIETSLSATWLGLSFGLAVGLGALGSLYPALKAARIKPAEAMRYE